MIFKVYHVQNKPIDIVERDLFVQEWRERSGKLLEVKPASGDDIGWQAVSDELDKIELGLREKYKCTAEWEVNSMQDLLDIVNNYGTTSICLENGNAVLYIMDLPAQQKVSTNE
jgi:hypothetical protein